MKVVNKTTGARLIAATGDTAEPGVPVEVPDVVGEALVEQVDVWVAAPAARPTNKESK